MFRQSGPSTAKQQDRVLLPEHEALYRDNAALAAEVMRLGQALHSVERDCQRHKQREDVLQCELTAAQEAHAQALARLEHAQKAQREATAKVRGLQLQCAHFVVAFGLWTGWQQPRPEDSSPAAGTPNPCPSPLTHSTPAPVPVACTRIPPPDIATTPTPSPRGARHPTSGLASAPVHVPAPTETCTATTAALTTACTAGDVQEPSVPIPVPVPVPTPGSTAVPAPVSTPAPTHSSASDQTPTPAPVQSRLAALSHRLLPRLILHDTPNTPCSSTPARTPAAVPAPVAVQKPTHIAHRIPKPSSLQTPHTQTQMTAQDTRELEWGMII